MTLVRLKTALWAIYKDTNMRDYVKTSDYPYAAYLMLNGYTLLGCVDPEDGEGRYDFYLTHADDDIRFNIIDHSNELRDKYQYEPKGFRDFYIHLRQLRRKTQNPIKKAELGVE